jgi:hypothetical protein
VAITAEITGEGVLQVLDPTLIFPLVLPLIRSETVTEYKLDAQEIADGATLTVNFGGVTAAKWYAVLSDGAVTTKVNGSATAYPVDRVHVGNSTGGLITSATITNGSGATRKVIIFIAG